MSWSKWCAIRNSHYPLSIYLKVSVRRWKIQNVWHSQLCLLVTVWRILACDLKVNSQWWPPRGSCLLCSSSWPSQVNCKTHASINPFSRGGDLETLSWDCAGNKLFVLAVLIYFVEYIAPPWIIIITLLSGGVSTVSTVIVSTIYSQFLHFTSLTFPFNTLMKNLLVPGCSHRYQLIGNRNIAASSDINIKLLKERFPHEIESIFLGAEENTTFKAFN